MARGGLVPAAVIARELDIRLVETACVRSYGEDDRPGALEVLAHPQRAEADGGAGWLVIDDLVDTGGTARALRALLPQAHFATLYAKPAALDAVDTHVTGLSQDTWVYFPWDLELVPGDPVIHRPRGAG